MNYFSMNPLDLPIVPPMDLNRDSKVIDKISQAPMRLRTRDSVGSFGTRREVDNFTDELEAAIQAWKKGSDHSTAALDKGIAKALLDAKVDEDLIHVVLQHNRKYRSQLAVMPRRLGRRTEREAIDALIAIVNNIVRGCIRRHEGVDLLAPIGTPVFAASDGTIVARGDSSLLILHNYGVKFLTFYQHLQNMLVEVKDLVFAGQQIAEVGRWDGNEDHLHFEIRYPFEEAEHIPDMEPAHIRAQSLPVDPTRVLYEWEVHSFQNDPPVRHVIDQARITSLEEVWRGRMFPFLLINVDKDSRDLFLPLYQPSAADQSLAESLKRAFFASKKVRIVWRNSTFFSTIDGNPAPLSVIAEVKVYG